MNTPDARRAHEARLNAPAVHESLPLDPPEPAPVVRGMLGVLDPPARAALEAEFAARCQAVPTADDVAAAIAAQHARSPFDAVEVIRRVRAAMTPAEHEALARFAFSCEWPDLLRSAATAPAELAPPCELFFSAVRFECAEGDYRAHITVEEGASHAQVRCVWGGWDYLVADSRATVPTGFGGEKGVKYARYFVENAVQSHRTLLDARLPDASDWCDGWTFSRGGELAEKQFGPAHCAMLAPRAESVVRWRVRFGTAAQTGEAADALEALAALGRVLEQAALALRG